MLYRILTEDRQQEFVIDAISTQFNSFTLIKGQGYWNGKPEKTLIIEISSDSAYALEKINTLCCVINETNRQECTLVQVLECRSELICEQRQI